MTTVLPPRTLASRHLFTSPIREADTLQLRTVIFIAAFVILTAALKLWAVLPLVCLFVGYGLTRGLEPRLRPAPNGTFDRKYAINAGVALFFIALANISAVASVTLAELLAQYLEQTGLVPSQLQPAIHWLTRPPSSESLVILWVLFTIPLLAVIDANNARLYRLISILSAAAAMFYAGVITQALNMAVSTFAFVILLSEVVWYLFASLHWKSSEIDNLWKRLIALEDHYPKSPDRSFSELFGVLAGTLKGEVKLYIHMPLSRDWQLLDFATLALTPTMSSPVLEKVVTTLRPTLGRPKSAAATTGETPSLVAVGTAQPSMLIPVPYTAREATPPTRLRAVLELPIKARPRHELAKIDPISQLEFKEGEQVIHEAIEHLLPIITAVDYVLDSWKVERARQALEASSDLAWRIRNHSDAHGIAVAVGQYFDCPVAIWVCESTSQWRLAATAGGAPSGQAELDELLRKISPEDRANQECFIPELPLVDICPLTTQDNTQIGLRALGYVGVIKVPLVTEGDALGSLVLFSTRWPVVLKPRERKLLELVSSQISLAFSSLSKVKRLEKMVQHIESVTQVIQELTAWGGDHSPIQDLRRMVAQRVQEITNADSVLLYSLEPHRPGKHGQVIDLCVEGDLKDAARIRTATLGPDSAVYQVALEEEPIYATDTLERFYGNQPTNTKGEVVFPVREEITSSYAARLMFDGQVIGVLFANFHRLRSPSIAARREFELLVSLAAHTLAISGYHQEWAFQTVMHDRKFLRTYIHSDLKAVASQIRFDLEDIPHLLDQPEHRARIEGVIRRAGQQAGELTHHIDDLLTLIDYSNYTGLYELGLNHLVQEKVLRLVEANRLSFHSTYPDGQHLLGLRWEKNLLDFALEAVRNAVRHARGHNVAVCLDLNPASVTLTIQDDGPGIADDDLQKLKDGGRFRALLDAADGQPMSIRNRPAPAHGLEVQLSVARAAIHR